MLAIRLLLFDDMKSFDAFKTYLFIFVCELEEQVQEPPPPLSQSSYWDISSWNVWTSLRLKSKIWRFEVFLLACIEGSLDGTGVAARLRRSRFSMLILFLSFFHAFFTCFFLAFCSGVRGTTSSSSSSSSSDDDDSSSTCWIAKIGEGGGEGGGGRIKRRGVKVKDLVACSKINCFGIFLKETQPVWHDICHTLKEFGIKKSFSF